MYGMETRMDTYAAEIQKIEITAPGAPVIHADLRSTAPSASLPLIIISHGFLGYKQWGFFPYLSERLASAGFHVLTFSFSHNGTDEETGMITRPKEFATNTVSREIADLEAVCKYAGSKNFPFRTAGNGWGLLGHSRGGAISILVSLRFPEISSLVTWSSLSKLDRYSDRRKKEWKRSGRLEFKDERAKDTLWLDYAYFEDINTYRDLYDLPRRVSELQSPHLIIHGRRDAAVTLREAESLIKYPRLSEVRMEIINGCGHTFGVTHPMKTPTDGLEKAIVMTSEWFTRTLKENKTEEH